jgi:DNA-binding winged helix-turn-helix (wHTH) protein/tetratricopeptide (TPR) repeat protein
MPTDPRPTVLHFDVFTLELSRFLLLRSGVELPLRPKAFEVLKYLADRPGQIVSREELLKAVWPGIVVTDDSVVQCIKEIRQALGDAGHRLIRTVPKRGYALEADVSGTAVAESAPMSAPAETPVVEEPKIQSPVLRHWRSMWLWAAPVRRHRGLVGAAVFIVAVAASIWLLARPQQHSSARDLADVLFRQADLRFSTGVDATHNAEARKLYEQALAFDGNHVGALIGYAAAELADVLNFYSPRSKHAEQLARAEAALQRAIKAEPGNAQAYRWQGRLLWLQGKPDEAISTFERSLALNPYQVYAHAELGLAKIEAGRSNETLGHIETAIRLSPNDRWLRTWYFWAGLAALHEGDSAAAVDWFEKSRMANPRFSQSLIGLAAAYADTGRTEEARALVQAFLRERPHVSISSWMERFPGRNATVAKQRERIAQVLRGLGVPEGTPSRTAD